MTRNLTYADAERAVIEAIRMCSLPSSDSGAAPPVVDDCSFESFGFDSLTSMEFCIALHCETGVELSIEDMFRLGSPRAVVEFIASPR